MALSLILPQFPEGPQIRSLTKESQLHTVGKCISASTLCIRNRCNSVCLSKTSQLNAISFHFFSLHYVSTEMELKLFLLLSLYLKGLIEDGIKTFLLDCSFPFAVIRFVRKEVRFDIPEKRERRDTKAIQITASVAFAEMKI